ncbi:hypothetical protein EV356DRAFT_573631 [Viridothelium virens]|uniref:Glycan binding protein Y3-like domain-containing protein n=1 Tax=Viridothelium virens TaxID=1048519 RepID=A0A6A6HIR6_VIRVR|nr:hypothetical protein EV356DRAFT_573631 [Viridothelium virens]
MASSAVLEKRTDCFNSGANWGAQRAIAQSYATEVCQGDFIGTCQPNDIRAKCYNLSSGKMVNFDLRVRPDVVARTIAADECYDGLQKQVNECDNGGTTTYGNWEYTADPNDGQCAPPS